MKTFSRGRERKKKRKKFLVCFFKNTFARKIFSRANKQTNKKDFFGLFYSSDASERVREQNSAAHKIIKWCDERENTLSILFLLSRVVVVVHPSLFLLLSRALLRRVISRLVASPPLMREFLERIELVFIIQSISFSDDRSFENSIADILSLISYTYYIIIIIKQIYQAKPANAAMLQLIVGFLVGAVFVSIFSGSGSNYSVRLFIDWSVFFLKRGEDREKERRRALLNKKKSQSSPLS